MTNSNTPPATMNRWLALLGILLAAVGLVALATCLGMTLYAIWYRLEARSDLISLTTLLLNWKVILGTLTAAGGVAFRDQIRLRLAPSQPVQAHT